LGCTFAAMEFSHKAIERAVNELSRFPGIGRKTALRMALYLLKQDKAEVATLSEAVLRLKTDVQFCIECGNISEAEVCSICRSPSRKHEQLCIVKDFQDIIALENTGQYQGLYHVVGGVISPVDGIGPEDLNISGLPERIKKLETKELIMAFSPTVEGEFTTFYLMKKLRPLVEKISTLSTGISVGGELEYADELTLARSLTNRTDLGN
jgi:recombination protein RecR